MSATKKQLSGPLAKARKKIARLERQLANTADDLIARNYAFEILDAEVTPLKRSLGKANELIFQREDQCNELSNSLRVESDKLREQKELTHVLRQELALAKLPWWRRTWIKLLAPYE